MGAVVFPGRKNLLFVNKKKQKTFPVGIRLSRARRVQVGKVFWFFFSKKNMLPCFAIAFRASALLGSAYD
jgi:hypothetical protein